MYSADSVITALKANQQLAFEGINTIGCPSFVPIDGCEKNPEVCVKGNAQSCKQPVAVFLKYQKLTVLMFRFFVSPGNYSGFIRKDDSALTRLLQHGYIKETELRYVKPVR